MSTPTLASRSAPQEGASAFTQAGSAAVAPDWNRLARNRAQRLQRAAAQLGNRLHGRRVAHCRLWQSPWRR